MHLPLTQCWSSTSISVYPSFGMKCLSDFLSGKEHCRTDRSYLISSAPWIKIPYPFPWGPPIFVASHVFRMMGATLVSAFEMESTTSKETSGIYMRIIRAFWQVILTPWRLLFAFVPPYRIAYGWISFICSLLFICGIAFFVTKLTDLISYTTGINGYVIASGTSWPDLIASKIAAERQLTADSAIANITCRSSLYFIACYFSRNNV